jgi:hypothetical protein
LHDCSCNHHTFSSRNWWHVVLSQVVVHLVPKLVQQLCGKQ